MIPKNLEDAELEVKNIVDSFNSKQDFYWVIADKETNKLIKLLSHFVKFIQIKKNIHFGFQ